MTPHFSIEELRNFDRHHAPKYAEAVQKAREARDVKKEILTKQRQLDIERLSSQILQIEELKKNVSLEYSLKLERVNSEKTSLQLEYTSKIETFSSCNLPSPDFSHLESSWQQTIDDLKKDLLKYQSILDAYPLAVKNAKKRTVTLRIIGYVLAFLALISINTSIKIIAYLVLFLIAIPFCVSSSKGKVKQLRKSFETAFAQTAKLEQELEDVHNALATELEVKQKAFEQDERNLIEEQKRVLLEFNAQAKKVEQEQFNLKEEQERILLDKETEKFVFLKKQESLQKNDFLEAIYESFESVLLKELKEIRKSSLKVAISEQLQSMHWSHNCYFKSGWRVKSPNYLDVEMDFIDLEPQYPECEIRSISLQLSSHFGRSKQWFTANHFEQLVRHPLLSDIKPSNWVLIQTSATKYAKASGEQLLNFEYGNIEFCYLYYKSLGYGREARTAQNNLGCFYSKGRNVNLKLAFSLFKKAADQDCEVAQYNLGQCYRFGNGVESNLEMAIDWYKKSASKGYKNAQEVLARLLGNEATIYAGIQNADNFLISEMGKSSNVTNSSYQQQEIYAGDEDFQLENNYALPVTPIFPSTATDNRGDEGLNRTRTVMRHFEQSFKKAHGLIEREEVPVDTNQDDTSQLVSNPSAPSKRLKVRNTTQRKRLQGNTANSIQPRLSPQVPTTQPPKKETDFPTPAPYVMRKTIELIAMEAVMAYEKAQGRFPEDVSTQNIGYDIDSGNETEERLIEVKGIATIANPVITENEYRHLTSNPNAYLYIVQQCNTENPQLYIHHQLGEHHFEAKITKYEIAYADLKREVDAQCNLF